MSPGTPLSTRRRSHSDPSFGSASIHLSYISRTHLNTGEELPTSSSHTFAQRELEWRKAEIALTGLLFSQEHDASFLRTGPLPKRLRPTSSLQDVTALSFDAQDRSARYTENPSPDTRGQIMQQNTSESPRRVIHWFSRGLARRKKPTTTTTTTTLDTNPVGPRRRHNNEEEGSSVILIIKPLPPTPSPALKNSELPPSPENISPDFPSAHPYALRRNRDISTLFPHSPDEVNSRDFPFAVRTATSDIHKTLTESPTVSSSPEEQYTSFWVEDDSSSSDAADSPKHTQSRIFDIPITCEETERCLKGTVAPLSRLPGASTPTSLLHSEDVAGYGSSHLTPRTLMDRSFATIQDQMAPFSLHLNLQSKWTDD